MRKTLAMLTGIVLLASMGTTASARMPARIRARAGKAENYGSRLVCGEGSPLCAEANDALGYNGGYTGHDEPSLLFYSGTPGSGNDSNYRLVVPTDPPILPNARRHGWDVQLPGPHRVLVRYGSVRQPIGTRVHA